MKINFVGFTQIKPDGFCVYNIKKKIKYLTFRNKKPKYL